MVKMLASPPMGMRVKTISVPSADQVGPNSMPETVESLICLMPSAFLVQTPEKMLSPTT